MARANGCPNASCHSFGKEPRLHSDVVLKTVALKAACRGRIDAERHSGFRDDFDEPRSSGRVPACRFELPPGRRAEGRLHAERDGGSPAAGRGDLPPDAQAQSAGAGPSRVHGAKRLARRLAASGHDRDIAKGPIVAIEVAMVVSALPYSNPASVAILFPPDCVPVIDIFRALGDFEEHYDISALDELENRLARIISREIAKGIVSDALLLAFGLRRERMDPLAFAPLRSRRGTLDEYRLLALIGA